MNKAAKVFSLLRNLTQCCLLSSKRVYYLWSPGTINLWSLTPNNVYDTIIFLYPSVPLYCPATAHNLLPRREWDHCSRHGWEVGRKHDVFHSRRLHDALMKDPITLVGLNWLSFGSSRAVEDIYGYHSSCSKGAIYTALQDRGKNLVNIVDR